MATAISVAKTDGSPVLVMTGEVPLDLEDRGTFQDASPATLDDTTVMAPLICVAGDDVAALSEGNFSGGTPDVQACAQDRSAAAVFAS